MTATRGASYASAPLVPDDERTVGDLLLDADIAARELLWDAPPDTAKAKARSWGEVVEAASDLWSSFPDRTGNPSMERIHKLTLGMHRAQQRTGWPGAGDGDPHLDRVVENLSRATEMISARRHPTAPLSERGHLDAEAARTRIMHVVYVASHGVGQALWQYNRDLRRVLDAKHRPSPGQSAAQSHTLLVRVGTAEHLAASYLQGRWPAGLTGQHREHVEPARLEQAMAHWDVQARRTLAASPTAADVLFTVKVERELTLNGGRILAAAAELGVVDADQHAERLQPALGSLDDAWARRPRADRRTCPQSRPRPPALWCRAARVSAGAHRRPRRACQPGDHGAARRPASGEPGCARGSGRRGRSRLRPGRRGRRSRAHSTRPRCAGRVRGPARSARHRGLGRSR